MYYFRKNRYDREIASLKIMIQMYCSHKHHTTVLCDACTAIQDYALQRYQNCPYGKVKPVCSICPVHCYRLQMRVQIKKIMRLTGPRMMLHHPLKAIDHLILKKNFATKLKPREILVQK